MRQARSPYMHRPASPEEDSIIIAILGLNGSKKSSFISQVSDKTTGSQPGPFSIVSFEIFKRSVTLLDVPEFDNTTKRDTDVLSQTGDLLKNKYHGRKLHGVIYVHRLADQRVGGVSLRNFDLLKELCGQDTLKNVIILTHMEDEIEDVSVREARVKRLQESDMFYKLAFDKDAQFVRHDGSLQSARATLRRIIDPSQSIEEEEDDNEHLQSSPESVLAIPQPISGAHISSFTFSVDGNRFAFGRSDNTITTGQVGSDERKSREVFDSIYSLAFSPDGRTLVFGFGLGVGVWRYEEHDLQLFMTHKPPAKPVTSVAFSPDGKQLASSSRGEITIWRTLPEVQEQGHIPVHRGTTFYSLAFSPDSKLIASGSDDKAVRVWDASSRARVLGPLLGHSSTIRSVIFTPDGSRIVSGSDDTTLRVWDATSGSPLFTLQGHTDSILSIAFSHDGLKMASSSKDGTVLVWNITSGEQTLGPLQTADRKSLWSVVFPRHREGVIAAAVSGGATIHGWNVKIR